MPKHEINTEYISALELREKVQNTYRAFQNFLEVAEKEDVEALREEILKIEDYLVKKRELIK